MKVVTNQVFGKADNVLETSLTHRLAKHNVMLSNVVNAQTPGYRALGYDFENQLSAAVGNEGDLQMRTTDTRHTRAPGVHPNGSIQGDLFVRPTESIGNDGNTVDVDQEMSEIAANQILYRATVELLNRRLGMLKYGINGGR